MTRTAHKALPNETLTETAWERQMYLPGLERFDLNESRHDKNMSETVAGNKKLRGLLETASEAIENTQDELIGTRRVSLVHKASVLAVPAETLALLTLKIMLDRSFNASERGASWGSVRQPQRCMPKGIVAELLSAA